MAWARYITEKIEVRELSIYLEKEYTGLADKLNAEGEEKGEIKNIMYILEW